MRAAEARALLDSSRDFGMVVVYISCFCSNPSSAAVHYEVAIPLQYTSYKVRGCGGEESEGRTGVENNY